MHLSLYSQTISDDIYGLALKDFIVYKQDLDSLYPSSDEYKTDTIFVKNQSYFYSIDTVGTKIKITNEETLYQKAKQGYLFYVIVVGGLLNIDNHLQVSVSMVSYYYNDNRFFIGMDLESKRIYDVLVDCKNGKLSLGKHR